MATQSMLLDPNAQSYTDNQIVGKINTATDQITRASSVAVSARPIATGEISNTELASGSSKANLDAMADTARGYVKPSPIAGQFKVIAVERQADGKLKVE